MQFEFRALDCFVFIAGYVADFYQKILSLRVPEKVAKVHYSKIS